MTSPAYRQLLRRVTSGTLAITAGGGVMRSLSTALAKQIVERHGYHVSFNEPAADPDLNALLKKGGDRLAGLYQVLLDSVCRAEAEPTNLCAQQESRPIHVFLKLQPYHLTAEERLRFFSLTGRRNIFSVRDPIRTIESAIRATLNIAVRMWPELDTANIIDHDSSRHEWTAAHSEIDELCRSRAYFSLKEEFLRYFCFYPILSDRRLKIDAWRKLASKSPHDMNAEAQRLGSKSFDKLINKYCTVTADCLHTLPEVLFQPLKFRRTSFASLQELLDLLEARHSTYASRYVIVDATLLQIRHGTVLRALDSKLELPRRLPGSEKAYSRFDAGFRNNPAIRKSLFDRVSTLGTIERPAPVPPVLPNNLPQFILDELSQEYQVYIRALANPNRLKIRRETLHEMFSTRLRDGVPISEYYFTTYYAMAAVEFHNEVRNTMLQGIRRRHAAYSLYFDMIDSAVDALVQSQSVQEPGRSVRLA